MRTTITPMTDEKLPPLEEVFHAALEISSPADRSGYLDQVCEGRPQLRSKVDALLASHVHTDSFLEAPLVEPRESNTQPEAGSRIGPYKLLQEIGEGGMGVVYMAEQEHPVRRKVAVKVIKLGMDTKQVIARFEAERQALALMEHPNIARVLDAGATDDGRPFFVMELVRGVAIDEYCDKHQLSTQERLQLFTDACRAVQHAHQKGIIHRDIKPGNVLVTSHDGTPVVKIIDFGVAKATHQKLTEKTLFTEFRQFIGTPEYMSPEQAEMSGLDVDTRSDIYSLGVLLYQLLVGTTPFDAKTLRAAEYGEMTRMIREVDPLTPSTRISKLATTEGDPAIDHLARRRNSEPNALVKMVRGDIDWIVMKAIEKDRTRRYDSASAFAEDIARHLRNEPVLASPPSNLYRARKLFQRNRTLVVAGGLATVGLLAGLTLALTGYISKKAEAERSNKISAALTGMLAVAGDARSHEREVSDILATTREVFGEDHTMVAAALSAMAGQLRDAGDSDRAEELYVEALGIFREANGDDHRTVGQTLGKLGIVLSQSGDKDEAAAALRDAIRIDDLQPAGSGVAGIPPRRELARILSARGDHDQAEGLLKDVVATLRAQPEAPFGEVLSVLEELLLAQLANPRDEDLTPTYRDIMAAAEKAFPEGHSVRASAIFGFAMYLFRSGRPGSEPALREALAQFRAQESPPELYLLMVLDALFQTTRYRADPEGRADADSTLKQFIEVAPGIWEPDNPALGTNYSVAARRFFENGRLSDALWAAHGFLNYLTLVSADDEDAEEITERIGTMIVAACEQAAPRTPDLERAAQMLDVFPTGVGETALRIERRTRVLRTMISLRLGRGQNHAETLQGIRDQTPPEDFPTRALLAKATAILQARDF